MERTRNVAILIFDDVEVLDFCGPFEVFSVVGKRQDLNPFEVYTVAERKAPVEARNRLSLNPRYGFDDCPPPDILIVPGGFGTRREIHNINLVSWIRRHAERAELLLSVCTGALLLAQAGLLDGMVATTHHGAFDLLRQMAPETRVVEDQRIVDNGSIVLSAGISAGLDMSFHVVAKLLGLEQAVETAQYMEYAWRPDVPVARR